MESSCVFCDLIGSGKTKLIYEDDNVVALPDIAPKASTHILVVPKKHIASVNDMANEDEALLGHHFQVAKEIAQQEGLRDGYRLVVNTGPDAGQTVHHIHMHILGGEALGRMNTREAA